jgi:hypothetical protein
VGKIAQLRRNLKQHWPFLIVLGLHLGLALAYSSLIPLGEAPDEPAHLSYARFIAGNGHLPANLAERQAAGYRANWPPLYHLLVAGPLAAVGQTPPTRLKAVGDSVRRLIPTDGQTIAAFIHTADEAWPWQGLPLAWHLGRLVSVALTALAVGLTYGLAWRLSGQRHLATTAAAIQAFSPQFLFIGSVLNDDNLLTVLAALILLQLIATTRQVPPLALKQAFGLGLLLGLALAAKYNALPLVAIAILGLGEAGYHHLPGWPARLSFTLSRLVLVGGGLVVSSGWWFWFIWQNFNQVARQGWLAGSFAALVASTSDASLQNMAAGPALSWGDLAWTEWWLTLFKTFWGSFGGGATIELPAWSYGLLGLLGLISLISLGREILAGSPRASPRFFFWLAPLCFLPLPLLRFILSNGSLVETAQGRHLFPAFPAIAIGLAWGWSRLARPVGQRLPLLGLFPLVLFSLSLHGLSLIRAAYPPPIPLRTTAPAASAEYPVRLELVEGIELLGFALGPVSDGRLPVTLVWQTKASPAEDYLIELALRDAAGQLQGSWLGQPLGGRYPTRAWDPGDILRHTIPLPVAYPGPNNPASLALRLLTGEQQPAGEFYPLAKDLNLPAFSLAPQSPAALRADELGPEAPFSYRGTLTFFSPDPLTTAQLIAPTGQAMPPARITTTPGGAIVHFIVAAHWPAGAYHLSAAPPQPGLSAEAWPIANRPRQFEPPALLVPLQATFADRLTLLGYDLPRRRVAPGDSFPLTLHWRVEQPIGQHLTVFNHLLDQSLTQRGGADRIPLKYYSSVLWVPGEIISDAYEVPVEASAPAGVYWLDVGLYPSDRPDLTLPLTQAGQPLADNSVALGPLKVGGPPAGVTTGQADPLYRRPVVFGEQIKLLGFDLTGVAGHPLTADPVAPPQPFVFEPDRGELRLTLYWQALTVPNDDYRVFIHVLDGQGRLVAQFDGPPAAGAYPTLLWDPGEIIIDPHPLPDLPPGPHRLNIGLYQPQNGIRLRAPGQPDNAVTLAEFR